MYKNIDISKFKRIQDLFPGAIYESAKYKCAICGKEMWSMHSNHFKKHGITKDEYIERFGFPQDIYLKKYLLDLVLNKMYFLYIMHKEKWLLLSGTSKEYITKSKDQVGFREFNKGDIKKHLMGIDTIGAFPYNNYSKFLIFDIDAYNAVYEAKEVVQQIKHVLSGYLHRDQIHVTYSGNKGYHIEIFFNEAIEISKLARVFSIVLNEICVELYPGVNIEMRPEIKGIDGRGVKLPCGANHKNPNDCKNYCYFLDDNFEPVSNEVEYFLNIEKSNSLVIDEIIDEYKNIKLKDYKDKYLTSDKAEETEEVKQYVRSVNNRRIIKEKSSQVKSISDDYAYAGIDGYLEYGLKQPGTRHDISFLIALALKGKGHTIEESMNILYGWSLEQISNGMSTASLNEIRKDISNILRGVFSKEKNYHLSKLNKDVYITDEDLKKFEKLNKIAKDTGKPVINHQRVLFLMLVHGKRYMDKNYMFFMTYEQMLDSTGIGSKTTICNCINDLEEWGFIDIVSRNVKAEDGTKNTLPNVYRLIQSNLEKEQNLYKLCNKKKLCNNCFFNMLRSCYKSSELGKVVTRSIKANILKNSTNCDVSRG